jgi:type IX secretion system PorP/SprF family membrane protein
MKNFKRSAALIFSLIMMKASHGQDPSFSQFFSSPLNINPALTANINEKWRVISNFRNQWAGPGNPYTTGTVSYDTKVFNNVVGNYVDENTRVGMGGMLMYDQTLGGALKSNYASYNVSGNIRLMKKEGYEINGARIRHISKIKMDETAEQRLGVGLGVIYGYKHLDFSKLTFGEQFNGTGFDTNLPSGESALSDMKPYISTSAGILYTYNMGNTNIDLGVAAFHFNKPKQTFVDDPKQFLATRYVVHGNLETLLTDQLVLNTNGIYQYQGGASYFSVGGALGYFLTNNDENNIIVNAGLWYWSKNAVIPYIGFSYGNFQVGATYDVTISKLNEAARRSNTFEFSLVLRGIGSSDGVIPAPWK